ncbi:hypothetical protein ACFX2C_009705 [Malus domestica]
MAYPKGVVAMVMSIVGLVSLLKAFVVREGLLGYNGAGFVKIEVETDSKILIDILTKQRELQEDITVHDIEITANHMCKQFAFGIYFEERG